MRLLWKITRKTKLHHFLNSMDKKFLFDLIDKGYFKYYNSNYHLYFYFKNKKEEIEEFQCL